VGNWTAEADYWGHVESITAPQPTYSASVANGSSDLGGQVRRRSHVVLVVCCVPAAHAGMPSTASVAEQSSCCTALPDWDLSWDLS